MNFLAVDIGATKTQLLLAKGHTSRHEIILQQSYPSQAYSSFEKILEVFLPQTAGLNIDSVCLGIAGPVKNGQCRLTNLLWEMDARHIARVYNFQHIGFMNDLEAIAYSIPKLSPTDVAMIHSASVDSEALRAVIGVGTGLGLAYLIKNEGLWRTLATEGGHTHFAATHPDQFELQQYFASRFGRVSNERLISGQGIMHIYEYLCHLGAQAGFALQHDMQQQDAAASIAQFAASQQDPLAVHCMQIFSRLLGQFVGDVGLSSMARGGIYLAGGVAVKNIDLLLQATFIEAIHDKGRMRNLIQEIPVYLIRHPDAGLMGALYKAMDQIQGSQDASN